MKTKNQLQHALYPTFRGLAGIILLLLFPVALSAQSFSVTITDLQSNDGKVLMVLFKGKEGYTAQKPLISKSLDIENFTATWQSDSIPAGEYILMAFHDENVNGQLDRSEMGMPEEGFAFSNNVQPKMGPPNADEMLFSIKENEKSDQNLKMIYFGMKPRELKTVEIVGDRKQFVKVDADKTTFQVKDNVALSGGSMRDAVRKLPGVLMSPSGDLNVNGKAVAVYIDGVPSRLSGSDLKNYMESLPANSIEKIELIENPGASYEANANGAVVNIITKSTAGENFGGTVNLHYGNSRNHKWSPSLMLNGRKNRMNWQLQTGYNWHQQSEWTDVEQTFTTFEPNVTFTGNSEAKQLNRNVYFRPMAHFRLTDNSYIVLNYNLNASNNRQNVTTSNFTENFSPAIDYKSHFVQPEQNRNNELVLKYKTMLDTLGRSVQVTGYYSNFNKKSDGHSTQLFTTPIYGISNTRLNLNNAYGKVDFEIPFKKISFATGAKYNYTQAHNLGKYNFASFSPDIFKNPTYNETRDFTYNEQNLAGLRRSP